ncbi:Hint domain-containing protein [Falsirhodobacter sp. alg1]|uniref:Hint domain-containing protein n=1 Tax=Falsirhodobacter sp. alg1 TaxID=1472418 RepID=UPI000695034B|nr:Hint domain-containing protein [Falsirhodobacter sp. alg1]
MADQTYYVTGDQIASYSGLTSSGNGSEATVTLTGVTPLGTASDVYTVVISQTNDRNYFSNGQQVSVYDSEGTLIYSNANPQNQEFQGVAAADNYQIFSNANFVIDVDGFDSSEVTYTATSDAYNDYLSFSSLYATAEAAQASFCFTAGTSILTQDGLRSVEDLKVGDMVMTRDHGAQPLIWVGKTETIGVGPFAPVVIEAGAYGNTKDLTVSQQHRMLIEGETAEMLYGEATVLVAAAHLVNGTTVRIAPRGKISYYHIACAAHEVIFAEGAATETMFFGDSLYADNNSAVRDELEALFPDLAGMHPTTAHRCLRKFEARLLA